jgi:beta-phosphoglucomutase-like phosphatase (HAD superfamily)
MENWMTLKAVFFDIDGTLVDSNDFHVMAWQEAFHDHGYSIRCEHIRAQIGKGADQLIPALLPHADDATEETIGHRHGEIFQSRYLKEVKPFPRAAALIDLLSIKGKRFYWHLRRGRLRSTTTWSCLELDTL